MRDKEKAAPVDQTESGDGQVILEGFDMPKADYSIEYQPKQGSIAAVLSRGRENAMTTRELARITGQHPRKITEQIQRERLRGSPIMSGQKGYWIAESTTEVRDCTRALFGRIAEQQRTANALKKIFMGRLVE